MLRGFFKGIATLALAAAILPASAAEPTSYSYKGETAYGSFTRYEQCVQTSIFVYASDNSSLGRSSSAMALSAGSGSSSGSSVYISKYDVCNNTLLMGASGYTDALPEEAFDANQQLTSARLTTSIEVQDWYTGETLPLDVDVTWTGNSDLMRSNGHYRYDSEGYTVNAHYNGSSRNALLSGTISDGTTNLIEGDSGYGSIMNSKSGTVVIE